MAFATHSLTRRPAVPLRSTDDLLEFACGMPPFLNTVITQSEFSSVAKMAVDTGTIERSAAEVVESTLRTALQTTHRESDLIYLTINQTNAGFCWLDHETLRLTSSQISLDEVPSFLPLVRHFNSSRSALTVVVDDTSVDIAQIESGRIVGYSTLSAATAAAEIDRLAELAPSLPILMFGTVANDSQLARVASMIRRHAVVVAETLVTTDPADCSAKEDSTRHGELKLLTTQELALLDARRRRAQAKAFSVFAAGSDILVEGLAATLRAMSDHKVAQLLIETNRPEREQPWLWFNPNDPSQLASLPSQLTCDNPSSAALIDVLIRAALFTDSGLYELSFADSIHPHDGVAALLRRDME
ncbi:MAG: hypothetical protein V3V01_00750 [Acidimicrobiales bacterium]